MDLESCLSQRASNGPQKMPGDSPVRHDKNFLAQPKRFEKAAEGGEKPPPDQEGVRTFLEMNLDFSHRFSKERVKISRAMASGDFPSVKKD